MKTSLNLLEYVRIIETLSTVPIDDLMASTSHERSKVMMQFMGQQLNMSTIADKKSPKVELGNYLCKPWIDKLHDNTLQWWCKRGSNKYPCILVLINEFLFIHALSSPFDHLFSTSRGILTFKEDVALYPL